MDINCSLKPTTAVCAAVHCTDLFMVNFLRNCVANHQPRDNKQNVKSSRSDLYNEWTIVETKDGTPFRLSLLGQYLPAALRDSF